jgi:hypothetical protein
MLYSVKHLPSMARFSEKLQRLQYNIGIYIPTATYLDFLYKNSKCTCVGTILVYTTLSLSNCLVADSQVSKEMTSGTWDCPFEGSAGPRALLGFTM